MPCAGSPCAGIACGSTCGSTLACLVEIILCRALCCCCIRNGVWGTTRTTRSVSLKCNHYLQQCSLGAFQLALKHVFIAAVCQRSVSTRGTQKGQRRKYSTGHKLLKAASPPSPGPGARGQGQGSGAWARGPGPAAQAEAQGPGDPGDRVRDTARVPRMLAKSRD